MRKNPKHHIFLKSVFQHILHRAYALNKDRILCTKKVISNTREACYIRDLTRIGWIIRKIFMLL